MEKIKAVRGSLQHPELVRKWLKEKGGKGEVTGDYPELVYFVDNHGNIRNLNVYDYDFLFDIVTLEKPKLKVIKGNKERGNEVIELLESLGSINPIYFEGNDKSSYYYIDNNNVIYSQPIESDFFKDYELEIIELPLPKEEPELKVVSGNEQYGEDVIATLKALGGKNRYNLRCTDKYQYYFVDSSGDIDGLPKDSPFFNTCKLCILEIDKPELKPFDKVLVRDRDDKKWRPKFFSHYDKESYFPYTTLDHEHYQQCIPYEGNEYKLQ